jgi:hypothetical protein
MEIWKSTGELCDILQENIIAAGEISLSCN